VEVVADLVGLPPRLLARLALVAALVAVVGLVVVGIAWWPGGADESPVQAPPGGARASDATIPFATATTTPARLVVHAAGAVGRPGVYDLPEGARVADLVEAAGGLAADADVDRLNLAEPVADGGRVYIPRRGEEPPPVAGGTGATPGGGGAGGGSGGAGGAAGGPGGAGGSGAPLDLNRATEAELEELPGIGPATAAAIVAHRQANGPFGSVDALLDVRGIGPAKLEQLRPHVVVRP
jgi:competence protein ComEA